MVQDFDDQLASLYHQEVVAAMMYYHKVVMTCLAIRHRIVWAPYKTPKGAQEMCYRAPGHFDL